jgi:AraC-like DNA-binding protein
MFSVKGGLMSWTAIQANDHIGLRGFFSFLETKKPLGFFFPGEVHNFWECLYIRSGRATVFADDRIYDVSDGTMVFHKPMELHKFHANTEAEIFVMSFILNGDLCQRLSQRTQTLSSRQKYELQGIIRLFEDNKVPSEDLYYQYIGAFDKNRSLTNQVACATELFLLSVCEDGSAVIPASESLDAEIFKRCVILMEERITEPVAVSDFAQMLNVSVSYLKKVFSKYAGIGVHKYFIRTKITYACKLLKDGKNVYEVADILSFSSPNYFCLVFKRETGKTPTQSRSERIV